MRERTTLGQFAGLCILLLSVTGFTALGTTATPPSHASALAGLEITEIDCADLVTAMAVGEEQFERYGLAEKLQNGRFAPYEFMDYIVCSTGAPDYIEDILWLFADMYYVFDRGSGELAVTYVEWGGPPAEPSPTPTHEPIPDISGAVDDDSQTTTVCIDATTPILEIGDDDPEQFDFWGLLGGPPCGLEMSGSICLDCGEDVVWRWLVPTPSGQEQEPDSSLEGRGGRTCFDPHMAARITGQELDEDDAGRLARGLCNLQFGPGDQVCWQCLEDVPEPLPEPTPTPVPKERVQKDPICSDYLTPEVVGPGAWEKYGIADKLRTNEIQRHLSESLGRIVCYGHREVDGAVIAGDELYYAFDIESGRLVNERIHWREDLPEQLPPLRISREEAEAMVEGEVTSSTLVVLNPDQMLFETDVMSSFRDPCWMVHSSEQAGDLDIPRITVINAITGEILGRYCPC